MTRQRLRLGAAAGIALALVAGAACGGDDSSSGSSSAGIVSFASNEPQNPLIPAITNEVGGGIVLQNLFAMPVSYQADGSIEMDAAESITSDDNQLWTIKLRADQTFTDGTDVTADSFVKAWQYAASDPAFENQWWFSNFEGYNDGGEDGKAVVQDSLSLTVVDDTTFTVQLAAPQSDFPISLGYTVFAPLPDSFFTDPAAFGENPVGNGPYTFESWTHDTDIKVVRNDNYDGPRAAQNGGLDFVVYATQDAAYTDLLSNNVDLIQQVPPASLSKYKDDLGDRAIDQPAAIWQGLTIPDRLDHFSGEEGVLRRQAISYAINRPEITSVIFENTRTPAVEYTSPVIAGFNDAIPGSEVTTFNADKAKELWAQADAIAPWDGTFKIAYNTDGGHEPWVTALTNQLKNTLGIQAEGEPFTDFAGLREEIANCRKADLSNCTLDAATRSGWQFDYPGAYNILGALYITGSGANDGRYSNPTYDDLVTQGSQAATVDEANKLFEQAQEVLFADLPVLPLWYGAVNAGYSVNVDNVSYGWDSWPILYKVTKEG